MKSKPMNLKEVAAEDLVAMLRHVSVETGSLTCLGCGHEHNCSTRGCALIREAADRLDALRGPAISMTREEAIDRIKDHMVAHHIGEYPHIKLKEALDMALSALRPVSREQVEKVWRGEWIVGEPNGLGFPIHCSGCGWGTDHADPRKWMDYGGHIFCGRCGAPVTDEAVEMVLERLEALYGKAD